MRIRIVIAVVILLIAAVGIVYYELSGVHVQTGRVIECVDASHVGDVVLGREIKTLWVPRKDRGDYAVAKESTVCPACQARRDEEAQRAEIERQKQIAQERKSAEAQRVIDALSVSEFKAKGHSNEAKVAPGERVSFFAQGKNSGSAPLRGVRLKIEPWEDYLDYGDPDAWGMRSPSEVSRWRNNFREMSSKGLLVVGQNGETLLPSNSQYYRSDRWDWWSMDGSNSGAVGDGIAFLRLKHSVKPEQDIKFTGYVVFNGVKKPIGTVIFHVVHPE